MSDNLDHRVSKLEFRVDAHDTDLTSIKGDSKIMQDTLKVIQDNLKQIKWIAVGAAAAFFAKSNNLLEILSKFITP